MGLVEPRDKRQDWVGRRSLTTLFTLFAPFFFFPSHSVCVSVRTVEEGASYRLFVFVILDRGRGL